MEEVMKDERQIEGKYGRIAQNDVKTRKLLTWAGCKGNMDHVSLVTSFGKGCRIG